MAVLVAIAIPIFTTRLEQSRETTDIANLRSAYAAAQVCALSGDENGSKMSDTTYYFDPNASVGIVASGGAKLGQGTATNGRADVTALPDVIDYSNTTNAQQQAIAITYADGMVDAISFTTG